ncbi:hypothetical protein LEMLEM_LOCUS16556 [Lemmus lemmus]
MTLRSRIVAPEVAMSNKSRGWPDMSNGQFSPSPSSVPSISSILFRLTALIAKFRLPP